MDVDQEGVLAMGCSLGTNLDKAPYLVTEYAQHSKSVTYLNVKYSAKDSNTVCASLQ